MEWISQATLEEMQPLKLDINKLGPMKKTPKKTQIVADEDFKSPYVCVLSFELELL